MTRVKQQWTALATFVGIGLATLGILYALNISTYVGGGVGDGQKAILATLNGPSCVATDAIGNLYFADTGNNRIRKVDGATGTISTLVGSGMGGFSGDGGPAQIATLSQPRCVVRDSTGSLYITDTSNHRVRRVDAATGTITTVAGTGVAGFSGDAGAAISARLNNPRGLAVDASGNLFIADSGNHRIRKVTAATGVITTLAGGVTAGTTGDGGLATAALLNTPEGVALGAGGDLFIADTLNNRVRKITAATGIITPVTPATTPKGLAFAAGNLFIAETGLHRVLKVDTLGAVTTVAGNGTTGFSGDGGRATLARLSSPLGVAVEGNALYIADTLNNRVRLVDLPSGQISTRAGSGASIAGDDGTATLARLNGPGGMAFDAAGNLYFADRSNHRIRRVDAATRVVTTFAGTGVRGFSADGDLATSATLSTPYDVAFDPTYTFLYFSDQGTHRVRRIDMTTEVITTVAGLAPTSAVPDVTLYNGDSQDGDLCPKNVPSIDPVTGFYVTDPVTGAVVWVAPTDDLGNPITTETAATMAATSASLNTPAGIAFDSTGNLYIADRGHHRIRKVDTLGNIWTVAGKGDGLAYAPNDGVEYEEGVAAEVAHLYYPQGIAVDASGLLYIADTSNKRVRRVTPGGVDPVWGCSTGIITTIAGGGSFNANDGDPATSAALDDPTDVIARGAVDALGNPFVEIFVSELGSTNKSYRVRRVDETGLIWTTAGINPNAPGHPTPIGGYYGDGGDATRAALGGPSALAFGPGGELFIADAGNNNRVRQVGNANQPPAFTTRHDVTVLEGTTHTVQLAAGAPEKGETVTFALTSLPTTGMTTQLLSPWSTTTNTTNVTLTPGASTAGNTHALTVEATDAAGNKSTSQMTVTVVAGAPDVTPPMFVSVPPAQIVEATGPTGAIVSWTAPTASDDTDPNPTIACIPASGSLFSLGIHPITCTAKDKAGNSTTASFNITVRDTTKPVLGTMPASPTLEANVTGGATHTWAAPTATDTVDPSPTVACLPVSGSTFATGVTTLVTCSATDATGNKSLSGTFSVTVVDTTPPTFGGLLPVNMEATGPGGTASPYPLPTAADISNLYPAVTCTPAPGTLFALGTHPISCTASDGYNTSPPANFDLIVADTTAPVLTGVPANQILEATDTTGAPFTWVLPTASDVVSGNLPVTCTPAPTAAPGSVFPMGPATTVACTATDTAGNVGTRNFTITVVDTTPPALPNPGPIIAEATAANGALVNFVKPVATDLVDGNRTVSCLHEPGSLLPIGVTPNSCSASDATNNLATVTFDITVRDTTPPALSGVPADQILEAVGSTGAPYTWPLPTASDAVDGVRTVSCTPAPAPPPGTVFPLGTNTVTCTASDTRGNVGTGSFAITVRDTTAPVVSGLPPGISLEATGPTGAVATWLLPTASDIVDGPIATVTCLPASGNVFAIATTPVTCSATDAHGNKGSAGFNVVVQDTNPPVMTILPPDQWLEATGPTGAVARWQSPVADDRVDGPRPVTCLPASGSVFAIATTPVTCSSSDTRGNTISTNFTITVQDTTKPTLGALPANQVLEATIPTGKVATYVPPTASDAVDTAVAVACTPASGSTFALGTNTVTCTATDASGNKSLPGTFTITVQDTLPPVFSGVPAPITAEASGPDGASVSFAKPTATDLVDGVRSVTCTTPSGPVISGNTFPLGVTTITCDASDVRLHTATATFTVTVRDTTKPSASLTAPTAGAVLIGNNITIRASGSDTVGLTSLEIFIGASRIGHSPTSPFSIAWDSNTVVDGTYTLHAEAMDAAGNRNSSAGVSVTVNNSRSAATGPTLKVTPGSMTASGTVDSGATGHNAWFELGTASGSGVVYNTRSTPVSVTGVTQLKHEFTGLTADSVYAFRVCMQAVVSGVASGPVDCGLDHWQTTRSPNLGPLGNIVLLATGSERRVDGYDLAAIGRAFGSVPGFSEWDPFADLNFDQVVDDKDLAYFATHFGEFVP